jgi:hypothetical protein
VIREDNEMTDKQSKTLFGSNVFPLASFNVAENAAKPTAEFGFGVTDENAASSLMALAEVIQAKGIIVQDVTHSTKATIDDFVMHTVTINFAARRPTK